MRLLVGWGWARSLGKLMGLPVHRFTHQHNHMFAGLWSVGKPAPDRFLLVHISGGTTDLLLCERQPDGNFSLEPRGTQLDLPCRPVSSTGWGWPWACPFRRGPRWKTGGDRFGSHPLKVWSREGELSLSGPCTQTLRAIEKGEDPAALALGVEQAIGKALARTISWVCEKSSCPRCSWPEESVPTGRYAGSWKISWASGRSVFGPRIPGTVWTVPWAMPGRPCSGKGRKNHDCRKIYTVSEVTRIVKGCSGKNRNSPTSRSRGKYPTSASTFRTLLFQFERRKDPAESRHIRRCGPAPEAAAKTGTRCWGWAGSTCMNGMGSTSSMWI